MTSLVAMSHHIIDAAYEAQKLDWHWKIRFVPAFFPLFVRGNRAFVNRLSCVRAAVERSCCEISACGIARTLYDAIRI